MKSAVYQSNKKQYIILILIAFVMAFGADGCKATVQNPTPYSAGQVMTAENTTVDNDKDVDEGIVQNPLISDRGKIETSVDTQGSNDKTTGDTTVRDERPFYSDRVVKVRFEMSEEDWKYQQENALDKQYVEAAMWYDDELIANVAIKPKGNSSLKQALNSESVRIGWKVDINYYDPDANFNDVTKLNFSNGFSDPTLIREALAYEVFQQIGIPSLRTAFVDLWVNDDHLGVYTMVEQLDKTFIKQHFADNNGNLYKPEMPAGCLNWTEEDYEKFLAELGDNAINNKGNLIERMDLKTNEKDPDHSLLFRLLDVVNNEPDDTFPEEIEKVLNVDEALRYFAVSTILVHLDNYIGSGHNYYLYDDQGKFVILPWDLNMIFGTFNYNLQRDRLINYYIDEPSGGPMADRPLVGRLLSHQPYLDTYHHYLEELIDGPFSADRMNSRIDELTDLIRPYVIADELKFFTNNQFEAAIETDVRGVASPNAIGLKTFVVERSSSVVAQLEGRMSSGPGDGSGNGGSAIQTQNIVPPLPSPRTPRNSP